MNKPELIPQYKWDVAQGCIELAAYQLDLPDGLDGYKYCLALEIVQALLEAKQVQREKDATFVSRSLLDYNKTFMSISEERGEEDGEISKNELSYMLKREVATMVRFLSTIIRRGVE